MAIFMTLLGCIVGYITLEFIYRMMRSGSNKPWGALLVDSLLSIPYLMKLGPYGKGRDIMTSMLEATKSTKLKEYGNTELTIKLYETTRKVAEAKNSAQYSPVGYVLAQRMMIKRMEIRLSK